MTDEPPIRQGDYAAARIGTAAAFTALLCVLFIADVFLPHYQVEAIVVTLLLATIITLLGLEGADIIRGTRK